MYNLYKLTNYRYINHTLNRASGQGVSMRTPYVTFSKSCVYTEFLSLTVFLLIAIISYVIPLSKYGFNIVISHIWFECLLSQFLMVFWRVSILLATGYDPSSLACSLFIWPGDDTEVLEQTPSTSALSMLQEIKELNVALCQKMNSVEQSSIRDTPLNTHIHTSSHQIHLSLVLPT